MTPFQFDFIIWTGILLTAIPAVILFYLRRKNKNWYSVHRNFSLFIGICFSFLSFVIVYGSFIEPHIIVLNPQTIDLPGFSTPIRAVFIADFQVGPYKKTDFVERSVDRILSLNPEVVFIAGDLIDNTYTKNPTEELSYLSPLRKLASQVPVYAVPGNHEYGIPGGKSILDPRFRFRDTSQETKEALESYGVHYLVNELAEVTVKEQSFYLFGGDEWWNGTFDPTPLNNRIKDLPTIVLMHNPSATWEIAKYPVDLMLFGHTHGGQIRLPFIGPIGRVDSVIPKAWYQGWYEYNGIKAFVTSGLGESGVRARLFNPPEIVVMEME